MWKKISRHKSESYHAQWNLLVPKAHPGCYDFAQHDDEEDNENDSDYIENEEDIEQQQPNNPPVSMCLSCGEACVEKFFFGCGHYPYCQNCQGNPTCSLCNQDVQFRSRMLET